MADSLAGLGTRAHSSICAVGFKVLKYVLIDLCDKCGVCVMLSVSWVRTPMRVYTTSANHLKKGVACL